MLKEHTGRRTRFAVLAATFTLTANMVGFIAVGIAAHRFEPAEMQHQAVASGIGALLSGLLVAGLLSVAIRSVEAERIASLEELTREFELARDRGHAVLEATHAMLWEIDPRSMTLGYASSSEGMAKAGEEPTEGRLGSSNLWDGLHPGDRERVESEISSLGRAEDGSRCELQFRLSDSRGEWHAVQSILTAHAPPRGDVNLVRAISFDVTERERLVAKVRQGQKLESVGRVAAGVAHEINTPIQFISDSIHFVRDAMSDLSTMVATYRSACQAMARKESLWPITSGIEEAEARSDLDYLMQNVPGALDRTLEGLQRVGTIVRSMKEFAHPTTEMIAVDLNRAIETTLIIARNEYRYVADVETDLSPSLPAVLCYGGDINQALLNIIVNAAHAIAEVVSDTSGKGRISVRTRRDGDDVVISVSDTGKGIPHSLRARIFDPFFTTKEVGKGTGQGLAIARTVIAEKHGGELSFESTLGVGTTFFIRLPIDGPEPTVGPRPISEKIKVVNDECRSGFASHEQTRFRVGGRTA